MSMSEQATLSGAPKPWIAGLLGIFFIPIGMLYVRQPRLAAAYLLAGLVSGFVQVMYLRYASILSLLPLAIAIACGMHAIALAREMPAMTSRPWYSQWYGLTGVFAVFLVVVILVRAFAFEMFHFPSASMLPTIPQGAHLVARKWGYGHYSAFGLTLARGPISAPLQRGDMIVFEYPQNRSVDYAKRLVGLPGDEVSYVDHVLSINGDAMPTSEIGTYQNKKKMYVVGEFEETLDGLSYRVLLDPAMPGAVRAQRAFSHQDACRYVAKGITCVVPDGNYFVLGDNRDNSSDSRVWGFVPADHIVGKVVFVTP